jgi:hypothetical protein
VRFLSIIYVVSAIHNSLVENFAGEHLARMKWFFENGAHFHAFSGAVLKQRAFSCAFELHQVIFVHDS